MPRTIIVSNRLPVTLRPGAAVEVEPSAGGLASALAGLAHASSGEVLWIGWPGVVASEAEEGRLTGVLQEETSLNIRLVPVWLTKTDVEDFYNGYSNSSLWPLLHWMTPYARFKRAWADSYRRVNVLFADKILSEATQDDLIWVQDFHLFLVPQLLRRKCELVRETSVPTPSSMSGRPKDLPPEPSSGDDGGSTLVQRPHDLPSPRMHRWYSADGLEPGLLSGEGPVAGLAGMLAGPSTATGKQVQIEADSSTWKTANQDGKLKIAFFLHVPFPSYEVICSLPQCAEIVEGVLGADLVGFHTYSYLRHFRSCVVRLCGFTPEIDHVDHRGQRTKLGVFPIGANCTQISRAMKSERFAGHLQDYTTQFQGKSLVLSVERLDYSKGMPQKLSAIERYLEQYERARSVKPGKEEDPLRRQESRRDDAEEEEEEESLVRGYSQHGQEDSTGGTKSRGIQGRLDDLQKRFEGRKAARLLEADVSRRWHIGAAHFGSTIQKLLGRTFRNQQPQEQLDHARTVFLFVAVPSRQDVDQYKSIELEVHRRISDINGRFSTATYQPIVYIHRAVPMEELVALYARADCCMVTPLVDGMNLVAKEFLVAKDRSIDQVVPGTMVLSELAGAAQELFDAFVVNPYDEDAVAEAIALGLELTRGGHLEEDLRWEVCDGMRQACLENDSLAWARAVLHELREPYRESNHTQLQLGVQRTLSMQLLKDSVASLFFEYQKGTKALFLSYDGIFHEFEPPAEGFVPDEDVRQLFQRLAAFEGLMVFIVSDRSKEVLEEHFGDCQPFTLIAEHGHFARGPSTQHEWQMFNPYISTDWINKVKPIVDLFTRCTPGSSIKMREASISWHYDGCDDEYGQFKAKELMHQLALSLGNLPCQICQGPKLVKVTSVSINKELIVSSICNERERAGSPFSEVLCIGGDESDESLFLGAPEGAWTVKVGPSETCARYRLQGPAEVRKFLRIIAEQSLPSAPFSSCEFRSFAEDPRSACVPRLASGDDDPLQDLAETET